MPLAWLLSLMGKKQEAYRVLHKTRMLPEMLEVFLPRDIFEKEIILMMSLQGRDQVARTAALRGWEVFENPLPELLLSSSTLLPADRVATTGCSTPSPEKI